jgi:Tc5 transposase DNA-binding domain
LSIRKTTTAFGVSPATLSRQIQLPTTRAIGAEHLQRLSFRQERSLVQWIKDEDARGYPPTHKRVVEMATKFTESSSDFNLLGKR